MLAGALGLGAATFDAKSAQAASTIIQDSAINLTGASKTFTFNQFDTSLGTLEAVRFSFQGQSGGSFDVTNSSFINSTVLSDATYQIGGLWTSPSGAPDPLITSAFQLDVGGYPQNIAANSAETFTPASKVLSASANFDVDVYSSFFSGDGTVDFLLYQEPNFALSGGSFSAVPNLTFGVEGYSSIALEYDYTPSVSNSIPLPLPVLGAVAGYSFLRRQRRRLKLRQ